MKTTALLTIMMTLSVIQPGNPDAEKPPGTRVVSSLHESCGPGINLVYTPGFRSAWTLLKEDIVGEDILMDPPRRIVTMLNDDPYYAHQDSGCYARAGFVNQGIIPEIKQDMLSIFGKEITSLDSYTGNRDAIICYSHLSHSMQFAIPFNSMEWTFHGQGNTSRVDCFGVARPGTNDKKEAMRSQVRIFDYRNPDDFIVRLTGSGEGLEIVLAKIQPSGSLAEMIGIVDYRMARSYPDELSEIDELVIPEIQLEATHIYRELIGKHIMNPGFEEYFFAEAFHSASFRMDEEGARAEATGTIVKIKGPVSRNYIFDKPFLLVFRKEGSCEPLLVSWIADTRFMNIID